MREITLSIAILIKFKSSSSRTMGITNQNGLPKMLRFVFSNDLGQFPALEHSMFSDRTAQFRDRLNWPVRVNARGQERDEYDAPEVNPLYLIWENVCGTHGGSMRFLPTTGPSMLYDHFSDLTNAIEISSHRVWECTRFCLAPGANKSVAAALILGASEIMELLRIESFVGVFDRKMERIYHRLGVSPTVINRVVRGNETLGVGLWGVDQGNRKKLEYLAGFDKAQTSKWLKLSLGKSFGAERSQSKTESPPLRNLRKKNVNA